MKSELPTIAQFLSVYPRPELRRPGSAVGQGARQFIGPIVPPGFQFVLDVFPNPGTVAYLAYGLTFGTMMPQAFSIEASWRGGLITSSIITARHLQDGFPYLFLVENPESVRTRVVNRTNLNQYWEVTQHYMDIYTKEDLEEVRKALARLCGVSNDENFENLNQRLIEIRDGLAARGG